MPERLGRCPNGSRRNKKTGKCVPIKKPKVNKPKSNTPKVNKVIKVNTPKTLTYDNGYKALNYKTVYTNIYKNPNSHKFKNISQLIENKSDNYIEGLTDFVKEVEGDVLKDKLLNNKPKPFKIKSKLRPIIHKVVKANNLQKIHKMNKKLNGENGLKFVEDYCGFKGYVMFKWLTNKYKDVMNEYVFTIEVKLTKDKKINYTEMKKCLTGKKWCLIRGLLEFAKWANVAKRMGKKYYITSLSIDYSGKKTGHANALVYDIDKNYIYRFEPHGWDTTSTNEAIDRYLKKRIQESYTKLGKLKEMPEYILAKKILPRHGPQAYDIVGGIGRCVIWTQIFLHYRLQHNHLTERQIFEFIGLKHMTDLDKYSMDDIYQIKIKDEDKVKLRTDIQNIVTFIKRYTTYLKTQKPVMDLYDTDAFVTWMAYQGNLSNV